MTVEFWLGMTTLPVATGLVALALITVSRIPTEIFGKCRLGHRIELIRDPEDASHTSVTGTTWQCIECDRAWRVVGSVGARGSVPTNATIEKETDR